MFLFPLCVQKKKAIVNRVSEEKYKKDSMLSGMCSPLNTPTTGGEGVIPQDISQQMWLLCVLKSAD